AGTAAHYETSRFARLTAIEMKIWLHLVHLARIVHKPRFRPSMARESGGGGPHSKTLREAVERANIRQVLECGCPPPLLLFRPLPLNPDPFLSESVTSHPQ